MNSMTLIVLASLSLLLAAFAVYLLWKQQQTPGVDPMVNLLQQQLESVRQQVSQSLSQNASLLQQQLDSVSKNLRSSSGDINQRLDNSAKLYGELKGQLGKLSEANAQIQSMVKDVSTLQDILRPPKLRGG